jgi:hypothetical protein
MGIERAERRVSIDGARSDSDAVVEMRQTMTDEGWTFAYERPAVDDAGSLIEDAIDLSFWRGSVGDAADHVDAAPEIVPERPSDWTRA